MIRVAVRLILLFFFIAAGVYFGYGQLEKMLLHGPVHVAADGTGKQEHAGNTADVNRAQRDSGGMDFQSIVRRNIFQASLTSGVLEKKVVEEVVPTKLDLTLLGTVTGKERDARAVIVDNKEKQQDIYRIGDAVQGATLQAISRGEVTLDVNGKKEALFLKDREGGGAAAPVYTPSPQRLPGESTSGTDIRKKTPRALPHRRISFRRNAEHVDPLSNTVDRLPPTMEREPGAEQAD